MRRLGWKTECDMLIDIVGDKLISGRVIIQELEKRGLEFNSIPNRETRDDLINHFFNQMKGIDRILRFDPSADVASSIMIQNYYCLTVECLREYKLNKLGI